MTYTTNPSFRQQGVSVGNLPTCVNDKLDSNLSRISTVLTKVLVAILSHPGRIKGQYIQFLKG
jgi:hypothetical protein